MIPLLIVLVTFAGYHALRWSRPPHWYHIPVGQPPASSPDPNELKVSFLVPAWNAADDLLEFIQAYRALSYPTKELVLCTGGHDGSFEVAKRYEAADIRVIEQRSGWGKQRSLRESFPLSSGSIIYLTDIDCRPTDAAVQAVLQPLLMGAAVATGSIKPLSDQLTNPMVVAQWSIERFGAVRTGGVSTGLRGANAALTRAALEATGSFVQDAPSGTDYTLARELSRHTYKIVYVASSEMPTEFPGSLGLYVRKQARWLRNVFVLGARYRVWGEVARATLTFAVPFVLLGLLAAALQHWQFACVLLLLIAHAILNRFHYARVSGVRVTLGGVFETFVGDLGAACRGALEVLRGRPVWS